MPDFQPYLETFQELWDVYYRATYKGKPRRQSDGGRGAGAAEDAEAHRGVPREFFSTDFRLERHAIFKQPLHASVERQAELNEELTGYLDLVEVSLFQQIRQAQKDQVFDSLSQLNEPLQDDLRSTLSVLKTLRDQLRSVQRKQLRNGLAVGRLARRKQRTEEVLERLDMLSHVQQSQPSISMLLQGHDYVTALELLETTTSALDSQLRGLLCARNCAQRINGLVSTFDSSVETDFVHFSAEAILGATGGASGTSSSSSSRPSEGSAGTVQLTVMPGRCELQGVDRLKTLCWCLGRRGLLKQTLSTSVRDVVLAQLKKVLKSRSRRFIEELSPAGAVLPAALPKASDGEGEAPPASSPRTAEALAADAAGDVQTAPSRGAPRGAPGGDGQSQLAAALSSLSFDSFFVFWRIMLQDCLEVAMRFVEFASLIASAVASHAAADAPADAGPESELLRLFEVLLNSHLQKLGVLLQARQNEHRAIKAHEWKKLLKLTYDALDKVRRLQDQCQQRLGVQDAHGGADVRVSLRTILYTQTKTIIEEFDKLCTEKLDCAMEQERWERTDVPSQYKVILDKLVGKELRLEVNAGDQGVERYLHVEGVHFLVVPAVLTLIQLLNEYVQLCREFESLPEIVVQRLCSVLKVFNRKVHELMLGGQAVQKQILKKITASNLALCSQCCGLVAAILPSLQAHLERLLAAAGAGAAGTSRTAAASFASDLAKIATEYTAHRSALFDKLSDLLLERYVHHSKKWLSAPHPELQDEPIWGEAPPEGANLNPHEVLDGFVKDITNMYRVLLKNLTGDNVRHIFAKAFETIAVKFEQRLAQEIPAPSPPYEDRLGRTLGDRLALDIAFLRGELEKASAISTPLQRLLADLVRHLCTYFASSSEPLRALHPAVLETLQRLKRLPC